VGIVQVGIKELSICHGRKPSGIEVLVRVRVVQATDLVDQFNDPWILEGVNTFFQQRVVLVHLGSYALVLSYTFFKHHLLLRRKEFVNGQGKFLWQEVVHVKMSNSVLTGCVSSLALFLVVDQPVQDQVGNGFAVQFGVSHELKVIMLSEQELLKMRADTLTVFICSIKIINKNI
jgi:hypothetical protein